MVCTRDSNQTILQSAIRKSTAIVNTMTLQHRELEKVEEILSKKKCFFKVSFCTSIKNPLSKNSFEITVYQEVVIHTVD